MIDRARWGTTTEWVLVLGAIVSALLFGAGAWIGATTGNWLALVLAVGLTAPIEVMLYRRHRRRAADGASGIVDSSKPRSDTIFDGSR